jgi:hypothetical protein
MKKIIEKIYDVKVGNKINWIQALPYKLGDDNKPFPFEVQVLNAENVVLETRIVNVPTEVLQEWQDDTTITSYILSQMGLQLDLDNTVDLVLAKLNEGTINFAEGVDAEVGLQKLRNYATFVALQIESYEAGDIEINQFTPIEYYDPTVTVTIQDDANTVSILEFVESLVSLPEVQKQSKLTNCLTNITDVI